MNFTSSSSASFRLMKLIRKPERINSNLGTHKICVRKNFGILEEKMMKILSFGEENLEKSIFFFGKFLEKWKFRKIAILGFRV